MVGAVLALSFLLAATARYTANAAEPSAAPAPDFVLKSLSGENLRLSEYRGDVVLLNFWATWCGECRTQLAELGAWHERYRGAGLRLLAINLDRDQSDAERQAEDLGLPFPILFDTDLAVSRLYDVKSMPVSVLIDRNGVVREVVRGFRRTREENGLDRVRDLLRE
jgi:peroxiredoxin